MITRRTALGALLAAPGVLRFGVARAATRRRIGLALPLTGVQAGVGNELLTGYQLAFQTGRAAGLELDLVVEDDQGKPEKTAVIMKSFGRDSSILATTGIVGTPHAQLAIPAARAANLPVIGLRSGAGELRDGGSGVFHLRASYEDELSRMMAPLKAMDADVMLIYSNDSFGKPAVTHFKKFAAMRSLNVVGAMVAERDGSDVKTVARLATDPVIGANALVFLMITRPSIDGIEAARANHFMSAIYTMSFTGGAELLQAGPNVYRGIGLASAFPLARVSPDELSEIFRSAIVAANRPELAQSMTAYEGFMYGTTVVRAIQRAGAQVTRQSLVQALEKPPYISVAGEQLAWDRDRVGRRYLQMCNYDAQGKLRS